jgi:hypothetical protein
MLATDTDEPVDYVMPVKALPKAPVEEVSANGNGARASNIVAVPSIDGSSRTGLPKPAGAACKAAVVALLRDAVAQGPGFAVSEIERLVVAAGLLDEGSRWAERTTSSRTGHIEHWSKLRRGACCRSC